MGRAISQAIKSAARIFVVLVPLFALFAAGISMPLGLYGEAIDIQNTSAVTYVDCGEIPAGSFTANAKYFLIANILFQGSSASNDINIRWCHGPDGSETDFTDGTWRRDSQGGSNGNCFGAIQVFTQPGTTEQVKLMIKAVATPNTVRAELGEIFALDLTDLVENTDYYFNEHTTDDATLSSAYEDGATITIVGDGVSTWWVCGDVVRNSGATTVLDRSRLNLDGNTDHTYLNEGDDTADVNSWLFSRSFVPDSSSVCKMQYSVASGTAGTYFSSRIFAINLTKFAQFFAEDTTADSGSIQTNFVNLATESVTPNTTGDWFYIGGFTHVVNATSDSLNIRLQDDNGGSLASDPNYGDDEPGVHAGDPLNEDGFTIFKMKSLTSGASRTVNLDARDTVNASSAKNRTLIGFALELASGATTLSPSSIASAEAFGSHTVTPGAVTVSPGGIATAEAFGTATIVHTVAPAGVPTEEAFGTAAINLNVAATGIASAEAFGSHALAATYTITAGGIPSEEAFGSHVVSTSALTITASGIASEEAFGSHTFSPGAINIIPGGIATAEAFGSHTVTVSALTLSPGGIASAEQFGSHTAAPGAVSVSPSGIASDEAFGSHALAATFTIVASDIASLETFGSHSVNLMLAFVSPSGIASAETFGTVVVTGGGVPKALAIDDRTFNVSLTDNRSMPASWIDSRSISSGWIDTQTIDLK